MPDFGVPAQCAGAAARDVSQDEVEGRALGELCRICEPALDLIYAASKPVTQLFEARRAGLISKDMCIGVALGENESFPTRSGTCIEDARHFPSESSRRNFRHEL